MKKAKRIIFIILPIIILVIGALKIASIIKYPFIATTEEVSVVVDEGDSLFNVINDLEHKKIMKNANIIKAYVKIKGFNTGIKPGEYLISTDTSAENFVSILNSGNDDISTVSVTIPEGYDIESIGTILENNDIISKEQFIESCKEYEIPDYLKTNSKVRYALEGYLFPDTYKIRKGSSGKEIIDKMLHRFEQVIKEVEENENTDIENIPKLITLASIVEKEARIDEDRPKIASVINNRLEKNMKLQVDATVLYALGEHRKKLYYKDLEVDSLYNTYKVNGLTPGPICSPGKLSIEAALNPEKSNYVFYVLQDNNKHYFTDNYDDFLRAKNQYKNSIKQ